MQKNKTQGLLRFIALLLLLSLISSSFISCTTVRQMLSKEDICANIASFDEGGAQEHSYVLEYLADLGIGNFDASKFLWVEMRFQAYYNLKSGLPSVREHAKLVAADFVENYYDKIDTKSKKAVTDALLTCYVNSVGDKYSIYRTPTEHSDYSGDMSGKFGGIGVVIEYDHNEETLMVTTIYIDSPAEAAGFAAGDYIVGVNGKSTDEIGYLNVINYVRGDIGTNVTVTVKRGEEIIDLVATRAEIEEKTVDYNITDDGYGYVQIVGFKANTYDQFVKAIDELEAANVNGVIFDLRGNPGGYVFSVCDMLSYLIPSGEAIVSYHYKGQPSEVIKSEDDTHPTKKSPENESLPLVEDHIYNIPMVVICNEYTASAGELFTAAIRDYTDMGILNGKVVGHTTFGKGIMQSTLSYYDNSSITMTVAYYNPPSGVNYDGIGVIPDCSVINELQDGIIIDRQLETAIEELEKLINSN